MDFRWLSEEHLKLADRVVEIRGCYTNDEHPVNFTLFPRLERLTLDDVPERLTLPHHKHKRLKVRNRWLKDGDLIAHFPAECAEQIVFIYPSRKAFVKAKARQFPPHVHVVCSEIGEGVTPEDLYNWWPLSEHITL